MNYPTANNLAQFGFAPPPQQMDLSAFMDPSAYAVPGATAAKADMWGGTGGFSGSDFNFGNNSMPVQSQGAPMGGAAPQGFMGKAGNWLSNGQNLGALTQGISAVASAYLGWQQLQQAREALGFQKQAFKANLTNSTQSYNTSLEDRIRGRSANPNESDVQSYLARHSLRIPK